MRTAGLDPHGSFPTFPLGPSRTGARAPVSSTYLHPGGIEQQPGRDAPGPQVGVIEATTHPASGDYCHRVRREVIDPFPRVATQGHQAIHDTATKVRT